jgi:aerobic C4-dicarboxylate transport protein
MAIPTATADTATHQKPWYQHLYVQVLCAIVLGVLLGHFYPDVGASMKPLGDTFIKLIKILSRRSSSAPSCTASPAWKT